MTTATQPAPKTSAQIRMPNDLFQKLKADADNNQKTVARFLLDKIASDYDYVLPAGETRRRKYASAEERDAAMKARKEERNEQVKRMLEAYQKAQAAGIDIDQLIAQAAANAQPAPVA